jgi:hypothetical protein
LRRSGNTTQADDANAQALRLSHNMAKAQQEASEILATSGIPNN